MSGCCYRIRENHVDIAEPYTERRLVAYERAREKKLKELMEREAAKLARAGMKAEADALKAQALAKAKEEKVKVTNIYCWLNKTMVDVILTEN